MSDRDHAAAATRILLVEDHQPTREEMTGLLGRQADLQLVGAVGTGEEAVRAARELQPDVVLMDVVLPGITGLAATEAIVKARPQTRVLALSNHSGRRLVQAMRDAGGMGYVRKDRAFEELNDAIRAVRAGEYFLGQDVND